MFQGSEELYKILFTSGAHVSFVYVGDVAHITTCLGKKLQILRGDKNGLLCICPGWNLQTLESDQTFSVPNVKEFIFPNCMGLNAIIYCVLSIYLVNLSGGRLLTFFHNRLFRFSKF